MIGHAHALSLSVSEFDVADFDASILGGSFVVEDFETLGNDLGDGTLTSAQQNSDGKLETVVGTFDTVEGTKGSGGTCRGNNNARGGALSGVRTCTELAIEKDTNRFGQNNLYPMNGEWSLNANDTLGLVWDVFTGTDFNRIVFGIQDPADVGGKLSVAVDGVTYERFINERNRAAYMLVLDFSGLVSGATIMLENYNGKINDSFSFDGAAVGVSPVPLPGAIWLFGSAILGAGIASRRRKQQSA